MVDGGWSRPIGIVAAGPALAMLLAEPLARLDRRIVRRAAQDAMEADDDAIVWDGAPDAEVAPRLAARAGAGGPRLIVAAPEDDIDMWGFALGDPGVTIAAGHDLPAILWTIARTAPIAGEVRDRGEEAAAIDRLRDLGAEIAETARVLEGLRAARRPRRAPIDPPPAARPIDAATIRRMIRARRQRERFFPAELFADPGWDILLDLMAARWEGRGVAVSSLCIASAVPTTTALRWIGTMTEQGLLVRVADPQDRRRVFIALAEETATRLGDCLAAVIEAGPVA